MANRSKTSQNNNNLLFLNNYPEKLVRHKVSAAPREFLTVSYQLLNGDWATFCANFAKPALRRDNSSIDGCLNILMGKPEGKRTVRIKSADGYHDEVLTNQEIWSQIQASRDAYKASVA